MSAGVKKLQGAMLGEIIQFGFYYTFILVIQIILLFR